MAKSKVQKIITSDKNSNREKINMIEKKAIINNRYKKNLLIIAVIAVIFIIAITVINSNKKIDINDNTNITKLDSKKYSVEITKLYNRDGQLDLFLKEMNRVQTLIGTYVISNSTLKEDSFSQLIKTLNNEINNDKWVKLDSEKSSYYNGKYIIDENGNLKFKFANKNIEPSWINNDSISRYVILN